MLSRKVNNLPVNGVLKDKLNNHQVVLEDEEPLSPVAEMLDVFDTKPLPRKRLHIVVLPVSYLSMLPFCPPY